MARPETIENPAPVARDVALSPAWLSRALGTSFPGVAVRGSAVVEVLRTVATKIRFTIELDDPGDAASPVAIPPTSLPPTALPPTALCVKAYFDREEQGYAGGETEGAFYREMAATLAVRTPTCLYVGTDPSNGHTLVLMKDLTAEGARFLTALTPYSVDQAAATLDQLAMLHASRWQDPGLADVPWLASRISRIPDSFPVALLQSQLDDRRGDPLPRSVRDAARLDAAMRKLGAAGDAMPACVVHGDAHAGNVFVTTEGEPGLIDWQIVHRGCWATDVAYHVAAVLDVDERQRAERDLLQHYLGRLQAHGVRPPSWDEAWDAYRRYLAYGYYLWGITRFVDPEITVEFVKRLGLAVAQHGTFDALGV
jgi:aminoglycoside phosphotransferase (APT) family kinase protein